VQISRDEENRDVHIALTDPEDAAKRIVVAVVEPACATTSSMRTTLANAKQQHRNLDSLVGRRVRVQGVGFYDFAHGQTGRSRNCIELHPVLSISAR
jgi:hypothetical protein